MSIFVEHGFFLLSLALIFCFFMAWGVGANDVANAMGTSIGSKALTMKQALLIAAFFEFLGAFLAGGSVTTTITRGIVNTEVEVLQLHPELLVYGMISSLASTAIWLMLASRLGWPVSTTHSIVGAIVGFTSLGISPSILYWNHFFLFVISWIVLPIISGCVSYVIFSSIQKFILNQINPFKMAQLYLPIYIFFLGFVVAIITVCSGLHHINIYISKQLSVLISLVIGLIFAIVTRYILVLIKEDRRANERFAYASVERLFGYMMIFTACAMAFSHGSNDVANAVGPLASVFTTIKHGVLNVSCVVPYWILIFGGIGIVVGLMTYGYKVINTIGNNIMELTPSRGFAAEISAAISIIIASGMGLPISTTQTLIGAIVGVGMARGINALNLKMVGKIFVSWVITLPAGALLSIIFFRILILIFGGS